MNLQGRKNCSKVAGAMPGSTRRQFVGCVKRTKLTIIRYFHLGALHAPYDCAQGRAALLIVALLTAAAAGCAGMDLPKSLQQSEVTEKREQRREEAKHFFERNREIAENIDRSGSVGRADFAEYNEPADEGGEAVELLHVCQTALADDDLATARECFHRAIALDPDDSQTPISAAVAAMRANRPRLAVEILAPAAERFTKSAGIYRALGAAYYRAGDCKSAQVALRKALSLDNSNALSYLLMGCTLAKLGQNEAAESHLRQARALDSRYSIAR